MQLRRSYLDDGLGGQIHLAEAGAGKAVLLIHQTPRSFDEFAEVIGFLSDRYRVVAMDLPGMGASSASPAGASIESYANAAQIVAENMGERSICVCGHHTGGVVALELASRQADWLGSLVLSSTPWIDAKERAARAGKAPIDSAIHCADGTHLMAYWKQRSPYYPEGPEHLDRLLVDALRANNASEGHLAVSRYEMERAVPKLSCPTLIIEHQKDPFGSSHTSNLQHALPHAHLQSIPEGHVALEVTAPEFSQTLAKWLESPGTYSPIQKVGGVTL